ncbi:unnamed protein product, partial [Polarella glacialis]
VGAVASLLLPAGSLLVRERPVLSGRLGSSPERKQFRSLPAAKQKAVYDLCDAYADGPRNEDKTLEGIFSTNALPRGARSEETMLCLLASRFNHSCAPNAEYLWDESSK